VRTCPFFVSDASNRQLRQRVRASVLPSIVAMSVAFLHPAPVSGQGAGSRDAALKAALEAHLHDFDYLLGDWSFVATNRKGGTFHGHWTAERLPGGQILDEFRIEDASGAHSVFTVRAYNAALGRWDVVTLNRVAGLGHMGTAQRVGNEIVANQNIGSEDAHPSVWHVRYHDIGPSHFTWDADQSADGGKTWDRDFMTIRASRVGPPHAFTSLVPSGLPETTPDRTP
jgi:hypothetical protein